MTAIAVGRARRPRAHSFTLADTAGSLVIVLVSLGLAAAAWWPVYEDARYIVMAAVTVLLGAALAVLGAVFRWPSFVVALVGAGLFLLVGVPLAIPSRAIAGLLPSLDGVTQLVAGVALGWKQLVTITLPVGAYQALLVPPFVLLLLCSIVAVTIALRAQQREFAAMPPVVVLIVGIAFGSSVAPVPSGLVLGLLGCSLLWLMWCRWRARRTAIAALASSSTEVSDDRTLRVLGDVGGRSLIGGIVVLAVASGAAVTAGALLPPSSAREVLRTVVDQPFDPHNYPSPLAAFRSYLRGATASQTEFTIIGLPAGARIRLATLDSYDGVVYSVGSARDDASSGVFVRIPSAVDQSAVHGTQFDYTVVVDGYSGVWVPTVGDLESVSIEGPAASDLSDGFGYNLTTGTAADSVPLGNGDAYTVRAVLPAQPPASALSSVTPGDASLPKLETVPDGVAAALDTWTQGAATPGQRLAAMLQAIQANGYVSHGLTPDEPASRSGHGADRITELVTAPQMIGDGEQYSVLAALMARQLGFPARVVFGFEPQAGSGQVSVTGSDVAAWIEVDTAEYGWIDVDVTPPVRPIPPAQPQDPSKVARPQSIVPPPPDASDQHQQQSAPESTHDIPPAIDPVLAAIIAVAKVLGWVVLGLAIVLAPFALVIAAKARRRRLRRTAPTPLQRIRGGWDEFADTALDHGYAPPPNATRNEVAALVGAMPGRVLAAVADRAVFAPESSDPMDADRVWDTVTELRAALDLGRSRRQRILSLISVRSLGGYSVRKLFRRQGEST